MVTIPPVTASAPPPTSPNNINLPDPATTKHELETFTPLELIHRLEHFLLKALSFVLIFHGLISLYDELIQIFYVFPHLDRFVSSLNDSHSLIESVYRRSIVVTSTAILETIYGLVLLKKKHSLAHRIHLISAIGILFLSFLNYYIFRPIDLERAGIIPTPPFFINLLRQESLPGAKQLFLP